VYNGERERDRILADLLGDAEGDKCLYRGREPARDAAPARLDTPQDRDAAASRGQLDLRAA
jgi:hypothetical protein